MAGAKETPRQKMIGMMYLVFVAMLALNMSKEVLSAFGFMNEELVESNNSTALKNKSAYQGLQVKAQDQKEKFAPLLQKATIVKQASSKLYDYIENIKTKMLADLEDKEAYESMDKTEFLDVLFFKGDNFTKEGNNFVSNIETYRKTVVSQLGNEFPTITKDVKKRFYTGLEEDNEGVKKPWLKYHYEGFPMVASLTNFTQLQAKIRNTESDFLNALLGGRLEADSKLTASNYKGIVSLDKTAYFAGEKVTGQVVLGRYDATIVPSKVVLNGKDVTKDVSDGQVIINMPSGNVGERDIKGAITFMQDGKPESIPFESKYSVIALPNDAIVSADKMNVVYRGLENPISISVPGVGDNNITPKITGSSKLLRMGVGKYMLSPGKGNEVTINVSAKLSSGKIINTPKKFRIKDIPAAQASARGQFSEISLPKVSVGKLTIEAGLPDFVFDLKLKVTEFKVKVPGQLTVVVKGNKFSTQAKKVIDKARTGDIITIFGLKAQIIGKSAYKLKKVLPLSISVAN